MSRESDDTSALLFLLAGVGIGAVIGAAAGLLFAPKPGHELRGDLVDKYGELKSKADDWVGEQRMKRSSGKALEEVGA